MSRWEYDPALEFPGDGEPEDGAIEDVLPDRCFRLVVLASPVLSSKRKIVVLDTYSEISIGRDTVPTPRLRLKEMAVSKHHAALFWDKDHGRWGVVDSGSVHGTFVRSPQQAQEDRLSPSRVASHPKYLEYLDELTIGGTRLSCHIHASPPLPCDTCEVSLSNEIPLFSSSAAKKPQLDSNPPSSDPRSSMIHLRKQLLSKHGDGHTPFPSTPPLYVDRAAARRELHGTTQPPSTPPIPATSRSSRPPRPRPATRPEPIPVVNKSEQEPAPISSSNIGHRLLVMQGWAPGRGLGVDEGRAEPIVPKILMNRGGIGAGFPSGGTTEK